MEIIIKSDLFLHDIFKEFTTLTNKASLLIKNVNYNKDEKKLVLPIKRFKFLTVKKGIFKLLKKTNYQYDQIITSKIVIKDIIKCEIINNCPEDTTEITILFGIQIKNKNIYISSAEEDRGNIFYEIRILVDKYNLEFIDDIIY